MWRREALSLVQLRSVRYSTGGTTAAVGGYDATPSPGPELDNQVALVARLRPRGGAPFVVAVTHLAAKKNATFEQKRVRQVTQLLDRLQAEDLPCIVACDLNAAPVQNPAADYPAEAYAAALGHPLGLRSAYREALGKEPAYTTWKCRGTKEDKHTIDYMFLSGDITVRRVLAPPAEGDVEPSRLPGWRYPSDHVALHAELLVPSASRALPAPGVCGGEVQASRM